MYQYRAIDRVDLESNVATGAGKKPAGKLENQGKKSIKTFPRPILLSILFAGIFLIIKQNGYRRSDVDSTETMMGFYADEIPGVSGPPPAVPSMSFFEKSDEPLQASIYDQKPVSQGSFIKITDKWSTEDPQPKQSPPSTIPEVSKPLPWTVGTLQVVDVSIPKTQTNEVPKPQARIEIPEEIKELGQGLPAAAVSEESAAKTDPQVVVVPAAAAEEEAEEENATLGLANAAAESEMPSKKELNQAIPGSLDLDAIKSPEAIPPFLFISPASAPTDAAAPLATGALEIPVSPAVVEAPATRPDVEVPAAPSGVSVPVVPAPAGVVPAAPVDVPVPAAPAGVSVPAAPADVPRPSAPVSVPTVPADVIVPAAPADVPLSSAPADVSVPAAPANVPLPAAPAGVSVPAAPANVPLPAAPAGVLVPAAPADVPRPSAPVSVPTVPADVQVPAAPADVPLPDAPAGISMPAVPAAPAPADVAVPASPAGLSVPVAPAPAGALVPAAPADVPVPVAPAGVSVPAAAPANSAADSADAVAAAPDEVPFAGHDKLADPTIVDNHKSEEELAARRAAKAAEAAEKAARKAGQLLPSVQEMTESSTDSAAAVIDSSDLTAKKKLNQIIPDHLDLDAIKAPVSIPPFDFVEPATWPTTSTSS